MKSNDNTKLEPKVSRSNHELIFKFSKMKLSSVEYSEGPVGTSLFYFPKKATVYIDVRGGCPGTINSHLSTNENAKINAICISGGSLLGLEAATGVNAEILKKSKYKNWGYVSGAIIYSGNLYKNRIYPDKDLGRFAFQNLTKNVFPLGQVGAGCSAGNGVYGQGGGYIKLDNGIKILVFCILNASGDIYKDNKLYRTNKNKNYKPDENTTITLLVTNVKLSYHHLEQLTKQVHTSMAETIRPFNTIYDGDVFFSTSTDDLEIEFTQNIWKEFTNKASETTKKAILSACQ